MKKIYLFLLCSLLLLLSSCGMKTVESIEKKTHDWGTEYIIYNSIMHEEYCYMEPVSLLNEEPILFTYNIDSNYKKVLISEKNGLKITNIEYKDSNITSITIGNTIYKIR